MVVIQVSLLEDACSNHKLHACYCSELPTVWFQLQVCLHSCCLILSTCVNCGACSVAKVTYQHMHSTITCTCLSLHVVVMFLGVGSEEAP